MPRAVFLDRDGTLIKDVHYLKEPKHIKIIDGVGEALLQMKKYGYLLFMHTNQSGIARGYYNLDDVHACNRRMLELYGLEYDLWSGICIAPEHPDGELGYRKPSAKYQLEMIKEFKLESSNCWMVGDKWIDAEAGLGAKMNSALVRTGKKIEPDVQKLAQSENVPVCDDLLSFTKSYLLKS